jgi:pimeloyl-ACP methyl ester carboxylesterase
MTTLVLLPGMHGSAELFAEFVTALGVEHQAIAISYPRDQPLDYWQLEAMVRPRLPSNRPFVLLGESFSGPIALSIAASPPNGLRGIVLCDSFARNPRPVLGALRYTCGILPVWPRIYAPVIRWVLGRFSSTVLCDAIVRAVAQVPPMVLRTRIRAVLGADVTPRLSHIRVPTLYLQAARDRIVPRTAARLISRSLPGLRVVEFDAPHFLLQAVPAAAAREVQAFLRRIMLEEPRHDPAHQV